MLSRRSLRSRTGGGESVETMEMIAQVHLQVFFDVDQRTIYSDLKILSCRSCKALEPGSREP